MGVVGISYDDFCRLTFEEIDEILRRWAEHHTDTARGGWERMRLHSFLMLKPFCKSLPSPRKLLPFSWDTAEEDPQEEPGTTMSAEERSASLEEKMQALGWQ